MATAVAARDTIAGIREGKSLGETFSFLAHNYGNLAIGDAFISTVEYSFRSMLRNSKRAEVDDERLHEAILRVMLKDEAFYNEKLIENLYRELTHYEISPREMINYQSTFDARKSKNSVFNAYYSCQSERVKAVQEKIRRGETLDSHEKEQAKGILILPGTFELDGDKGPVIKWDGVLKKIRRFFKKVWRGVEIHGVLISVSTLWPGLAALLAAIVCFVQRYAIPVSVIACAFSMLCAAGTVWMRKEKKLLRNISLLFLIAIPASIIFIRKIFNKRNIDMVNNFMYLDFLIRPMKLQVDGEMVQIFADLEQSYNVLLLRVGGQNILSSGGPYKALLLISIGRFHYTAFNPGGAEKYA